MANKTYKSTHSGEEIDVAIDKISALDINNYYDKQEINDKLSQKLDIDRVGDDYYNKTEIDDQTHFEEDTKPAQISVGNIKEGTKLAGLSLKTILKMMFYGEVAYPNFTEPNLKCSITSNLFSIYGTSYVISGILNFDRGEINPAYETNGFRAGLPYKYAINDAEFESERLEYSFSYNIAKLEPGNNKIEFKVFYNEGEQPTDSAGAPYDKSYPSGEIMDTIDVIGLTASFSGLNDKVVENDFSIELIPLEDKGYTKNGLFGENNNIYGYQVTTPNVKTEKDCQVVLIPDDVKIFGIQSWDTVGGNWKWFYGEDAAETLESNVWIKTDEVVSKQIDETTIKYRKYKYNVEDYGLMDENYFRFFLKEIE